MGNKKSKKANQSVGAKYTFGQQKGTAAQLKVQKVQNILLIWLDSKIDDNNADCCNTITQLHQTVNDINTFTDGEKCIQFIKNITNNKVCMIISGALGQHIVPRIHEMSQVNSIFIFCGNKKYHEQWVKDYPKIMGVFTEISPICEALKKVAQQCEQNAISVSFIATSSDMSKKNLDQLDPIFMYSQILKEILLTIEFDNRHIKEFFDHCRNVFAENDKELTNVAKLQCEYHTKTPIWWYTCDSFLYSMLNRALRLMDMDTIIKMGFFISGLHHHIEQLHSEQFIDINSNEIFTLYRGQSMSKPDFDQMIKTQGGLISFNTFLSTTKDRQVSLGFAQHALPNMDMVGILFVMTIDPMKSTTPFASIVNVGYYGDKEDEVLFSMHTVFRIGEITSMDKNQRLFQVQLTLTSDDDKDLRVLTGHIREETDPNDEGWYRLGSLLLKVGESTKAQKVYEMLLEQTTNEGEKGRIFSQLGSAKDDQGEYDEAITFYENALEIYKRTLSPTDLNLANCYNNIGVVYESISDYPKALSSHEKALTIQQQSLPSNHPELGMSYNNIGLVYSKMDNYSKALSYYEKDLEIQKQSLPSNHPSLGGSYNNIGNVYYKMDDYPKALSYYEKAFEIRKHSLPSNHPELGSSYNNIGLVYSNMSDYPKALSYYERALDIRKQSLPSNHPELGMSYNNIGIVYSNMSDYPKAISYYEKALEIQQQSLPSNNLDLGSSYTNIGRVYCNMRDYPKALSYYEKALEVSKHSLSSNHPDLGMSYSNIGNVYYNMGDYPKALTYHDKDLEIQQQSFLGNHCELGMSYNNIGNVYRKMGDSPRALSYYEKALDVRKQSLPSNHPSLSDSYNSIGGVYYKRGDYPKALSYYEKAFEIRKQSLPSNHPELGSSYNNIGGVYRNMGNCSKALSYYEKALEIKKESLPLNHPDLASSYNNIGRVYFNMGDYQKARSFYKQAVEIGQYSLPENHPHLQIYKKNLDNVKNKK